MRTVLYKDKACSRCQEIKDLDQYNLSKRSVDGHYHVCLVCLDKARIAKNEARRFRYHDDSEYRAKAITGTLLTRKSREQANPELKKIRSTKEVARRRNKRLTNPQWAEVQSAKQKANYRRTKRETHMVSRYGIDLKGYLKLKETQGNCCRLCSRKLPDGAFGGRAVALDHCHLTGRIRGVLCNGCNTALGKLGDNVEGLRHALVYVTGPLPGTSAGLLF